ncbi:MAG: hypothetical protein ACTHOM_04850 [Allomuricauda sp.]
MATIPRPVVMEFEQDTEKIFKEVRHYDLIKGKDLFSQRLNIGINRGFSKAQYTYSLKIWKGKKWSGQLTGLFKTNDPNLFYGDTMDKKNLVIARFTQNGKRLRLYYFENFYTRRISAFLKTFKEHY